MTLFDAVYINQGGGKVLLEYLIQVLIKEKLINNFSFLLDNRLQSEYIKFIPNQTLIEPSETYRQKIYNKNKGKFDKIFCFSNVPPPIKVIDSEVFIFFQNAHILNPSLGSLSLKLRFNYFLKKKYIQSKNLRSYKWIVQTSNLKQMLYAEMLNRKQDIFILPFFDANKFVNDDKGRESNRKKNQFLFVASGQIQKNHEYLFDVWDFLFDKYKINLTLYITIENPSNIQKDRIYRFIEKGINVINLGNISFEKLKTLYEESDYLVFPSQIESLGLPLIEAAAAGCKIIAINKPYVNDVIKPSATFNDKDINSLASIIIGITKGNILPSSKIILKECTYELIRLIK